MHFKDQIRKAFFNYALIPSLMLSIGCYVVLYCTSYAAQKSQNERNTYSLAYLLEEQLTRYQYKAAELSKNIIWNKVNQDIAYTQSVYEDLYNFMNNIELKSNLYIFDTDYNIIMSTTTLIPEYSQQNYQWGIFKKLKLSPYDTWIMPNKSYLGNEKFSILSVGKAINQKDIIKGYVIFDIKEDSLKNIVGKNNSYNIIIADQHKNIIMTTNNVFQNENGKVRTELAEHTGYIQVDGNSFYVSSKRLADTNLKVYTVSSMAFLKDALKMGILFIMIICLVLVVTFSRVAKKIADDKTKVIDEIVRGIQEVQKGNLDTYLDIQSEDEFRIIADAYNQMLEDIKRLIKLNEEKVRHSIQSEIKQLESQFNPHFIFNTLEMLKYTVKLDQQIACKLIINLSSLLRYSINGDSSEVTIKQDMAYTKSYLEIQSHRFEGRFKYTMSIYDDTEHYKIPKLTIQPLIENAIKYGFNTSKVLTVQISIRCVETHLVIVVYDDGRGMTKEKVEELNKILHRKVQENNHIGLYNVHRRIQLMYGDEYGLTVNSQLEEGTVIKIILPLLGGK